MSASEAEESADTAGSAPAAVVQKSAALLAAIAAEDVPVDAQLRELDFDNGTPVLSSNRTRLIRFRYQTTKRMSHSTLEGTPRQPSSLRRVLPLHSTPLQRTESLQLRKLPMVSLVRSPFLPYCIVLTSLRIQSTPRSSTSRIRAE